MTLAAVSVSLIWTSITDMMCMQGLGQLSTLCCQGHTKDVFSVAFSADNHQIVSGSRDKTIKLWNTLGECKYTITEDMHTDWVSCVAFSPSAKMPLIISGGWDRLVKVWNLSNCKLRTNLAGHTGVVYTTAISPDGSLCASGGKDGIAMLWDVNDGKHLYSLDAGGTINALSFSPKNYWLVAATDTSIKVWDLENKNILDELQSSAPPKNGIPLGQASPHARCVTWGVLVQVGASAQCAVALSCAWSR